jgi:hypothetical protein
MEEIAAPLEGGIEGVPLVDEEGEEEAEEAVGRHSQQVEEAVERQWQQDCEEVVEEEDLVQQLTDAQGHPLKGGTPPQPLTGSRSSHSG